MSSFVIQWLTRGIQDLYGGDGLPLDSRIIMSQSFDESLLEQQIVVIHLLSVTMNILSRLMEGWILIGDLMLHKSVVNNDTSL